MRKIALVSLIALPLAGCGAAVDLAVMSGSVTILEPLVNNNPNRKPLYQSSRPICYYAMSPYLVKADVCPVGVVAGTRIYKY